jgi:hypothetical protein
LGLNGVDSQYITDIGTSAILDSNKLKDNHITGKREEGRGKREEGTEFNVIPLLPPCLAWFDKLLLKR